MALVMSVVERAAPRCCWSTHHSLNHLSLLSGAIANMPFSLNDHCAAVSQAGSVEEIRDIVVLIFREVVMRWTGCRGERTGFEDATEQDLHYAFYRAVNELLVRWSQARYPSGNTWA